MVTQGYSCVAGSPSVVCGEMNVSEVFVFGSDWSMSWRTHHDNDVRNFSCC